MKKNYLIILFMVSFTTLFSYEDIKSENIDPDIGARIIIEVGEGFIKNETIAIQVAEILLEALYGESVHKSKPYIAELVEDGTVWLIKGTFHDSPGMYSSGGIPYIKIAKKDGRVIGFIHTK